MVQALHSAIVSFLLIFPILAKKWPDITGVFVLRASSRPDQSTTSIYQPSWRGEWRQQIHFTKTLVGAKWRRNIFALGSWRLIRCSRWFKIKKPFLTKFSQQFQKRDREQDEKHSSEVSETFSELNKPCTLFVGFVVYFKIVSCKDDVYISQESSVLQPLGVALNVWFTTNGMCVKNNNIYMWREQAVIEKLRRMISIVACCHSAKLSAHAARAFRT